MKIYQGLIKSLALNDKWKFKHYLINVILRGLIYAHILKIFLKQHTRIWLPIFSLGKCWHCISKEETELNIKAFVTYMFHIFVSLIITFPLLLMQWLSYLFTFNSRKLKFSFLWNNFVFSCGENQGRAYACVTVTVCQLLLVAVCLDFRFISSISACYLSMLIRPYP